MRRAKIEYRKTFIIVRGHGDFPFDMLRYDNACPATSADVSCMLDPERRNTPFLTTRDVKLERFSLDGGKAEHARWKSFGWEVVDDSGVE